MQRVGDLRKAKVYDNTLSEKLDLGPNLKVEKSNPYYIFTQSMKSMRETNIYNQSILKIKEAITLKPVPPSSSKPQGNNPKLRFVKTAGRKRKNKKEDKLKSVNKSIIIIELNL